MRISSQLSDTPIMTLAIAGGILAALLTLVVIETPERMIDTAIHFDMSVTAFFGRFARRSPVVDTLLWWAWTQPATQAGIVMALLWGAWFANGETPEGRPKRVAMLSALVGTYASILVTLVFRVILPFRARPIADPTSTLLVPYLPDGMTFTSESTSFPSGHAAVLFALAVGLWSASRALGLVVALHGLFVVCLPRVYFGRHWATDILAGAAVALVTVPLVNEMLRRSSVMPRLLGWSERHASAFYGAFFLCALEIATEFAFVRTALKFASVFRLIGSSDIAKVVMWLASTTPA